MYDKILKYTMVSVSLKKFFRNSRSAVGLCNIIVNCQVKIAEVLLSSAVQCTYYLLACFYFCSSKFKFKETHSIYQDSKVLATIQLWYIHFILADLGQKSSVVFIVALPQITHKLVLTGFYNLKFHFNPFSQHQAFKY